MNHPRYDAEARLAEIAAATVFSIMSGLLIWPPGAVYWTDVANALGDGITLTLVSTLAVVLGAWFARTSAFALVHIFVGGVIAYGLGMAAIAVLLHPTSPAHLVWYGALLACLLGGAAIYRSVAWLGQRRGATAPEGTL